MPYQKDAVIRYKANPAYWGREKAMVDRPRLRDHAGPDGALQQAQGRRVPLRRSRRARPTCAAMQKDPKLTGHQQARSEHRLLGLQHTRSRRSTRRTCARPSTWRSTRRRSSDDVYLGAGQAAKNLIPPTMWAYDDTVKHDRLRPGEGEGAAGQGRRARRRWRSTSGTCRCSGRTTRTPSASPR
ncbi:MAG: hypothetical protein MZW92_73160 [Comamonadaceae bacterium]|nr:hypothetical protein [Comamonadaceae bacterium]